MSYRSKTPSNVNDISEKTRVAVLEGYAELLSRYPWDVFCHLSWRKESAPEVMVRNFKRWLYLWQLYTAVSRKRATIDENGRAHGSWINSYRKQRQSPVWVFGIERGERGGRLHAHAIIKWSEKLPNLRRTKGHAMWFEAYGMNKLEPPKSQEDVGKYVSKYVAKDGEVYFSSSFDAARLPGRIRPVYATTKQVVESGIELRDRMLQRAS